MTEKIGFDGEIAEVAGRLILRFPQEASARLPSRGQVAVHAVLDGHDFDTVLEPDGMRGHWLSIDDVLRDELGLQGGGSASLEVEPSKSWPEPRVPDDLREALDAAPDLAETWRDITPMARWEWVRWVGATKSPVTRAKRVAVSISKLRDGKRRPCCFDLSSCTDPELAKSGKLISA